MLRTQGQQLFFRLFSRTRMMSSNVQSLRQQKHNRYDIGLLFTSWMQQLAIVILLLQALSSTQQQNRYIVNGQICRRIVRFFRVSLAIEKKYI